MLVYHRIHYSLATKRRLCAIIQLVNQTSKLDWDRGVPAEEVNKKKTGIWILSNLWGATSAAKELHLSNSQRATLGSPERQAQSQQVRSSTLTVPLIGGHLDELDRPRAK